MGLILTTNKVLKDGRTIALRNAIEKDAQPLLESIQIYLNENEGQVWSPHEYHKSEDDFQEWIKEMLSHPLKILIIAEFKGTIIGNIDFHIGDKLRIKHSGEFGMGIIPNWRNKGLGSLMLLTLLEWVQNHQEIEKINLNVLSNNHRAIELYKKIGFQEEGRRIKAFKFSTSEYVDDILMTRFTS
jgi:RimJ/RimL family protein N-acetyltransferase